MKLAPSGLRNGLRVQVPATILSTSVKHALLTDYVSEEGICLRTDDPPRLMELLRVKLVLPPNDEELIVHGMVTNVVAPREGKSSVPGAEMSFYALDAATQRSWKSFLEHVEINYPAAKDAPLLLASSAAAKDQVSRRFPRRAMNIQVDVGHGEAMKKRFTLDLSEGGAFIVTADPHRVGRRVLLALVHPLTGARIPVEGVVRRVTSGPRGGMAIEFENVSPSSRQAIAQLVATTDASETERAPAVASLPTARPGIERGAGDLPMALRTELSQLLVNASAAPPAR